MSQFGPLAVQADGKLVAAGQTGTDQALAGYGSGTTSTTTSSHSTSSTTTSTTTARSPFTPLCLALEQLRSGFAATPWIRPFLGIIDAVRSIPRCT